MISDEDFVSGDKNLLGGMMLSDTAKKNLTTKVTTLAPPARAGENTKKILDTLSVNPVITMQD